ncbi:hypothetical protein [Succinimonas amylolytica]|uniref:hypothetical protein n=1 Tax=Succinimonas amylolytica TaxID=83769 RepID=UPI0023A8D1D5
MFWNIHTVVLSFINGSSICMKFELHMTHSAGAEISIVIRDSIFRQDLFSFAKALNSRLQAFSSAAKRAIWIKYCLFPLLAMKSAF